MKTYELILLIDTAANEEQRNEALTVAQNLIEKSGELQEFKEWGERNLVYEIDHKGQANYYYFNFSGDNELLDELNHNLKITEGVLRYRILRAGKPNQVPATA